MVGIKWIIFHRFVKGGGGAHERNGRNEFTCFSFWYGHNTHTTHTHTHTHTHFTTHTPSGFIDLVLSRTGGMVGHSSQTEE